MLRSLRLAEHGLRWSDAPVVLAHPPRPQADTTAGLHRDPQDTAAGLAAEHPADGPAWLELVEQWQRVRPAVLRAPIPWRAPGVHGAGTVHVGCDEPQMAHWSADLESATLPRTPFLLVGQMTTADASRSPAGTESV